MTKWNFKRFAAKAILGGALTLTITMSAHGQQRGARSKQFQRVPCPPPYSVVPDNCPPEMTIPDNRNEPVSPVPDSDGNLRLPTDSEQQPNASDSTTSNPNTNPQSVDQQLQNAQQPLSPQTQQQFSTARADASARGNFGVTTAPNMIGDFIGFVNTSNFSAGSGFAPLTISNFGGVLDGLSSTPNGSDFDVTLPQGLTGNGFSLSQDVNATFNGSDGLINTSSLDDGERTALLTFLSQQGSQQQGRTVSLKDSELGNLHATNVGPGTADIDFAGIDSFLVGGFSENLSISLPRTGTQVSRYKISEQSSPIPRDRFIFSYSGFNSVPFSGGNLDVQRFVPGFEKTFNSGDSSLEVRMPFASTLDNNQTIDGNGVLTGGTATQLGNLSMSLKQLVAQGENAAISTGVILELPTADDIHYSNSVTSIRRYSQSVQLSPFIGGLVTPTDRTFLQAFTQVAFDTNGEAVVVTDKIFSGSGAGRLQDPTTLFVDLQAGAWAYRDESATRLNELSGLSGFLEIHFNQALQRTDSLTTVVSGNTYTIGERETIAVTNLTAGSTIELGKQSTITCAYVVPLTHQDRQFNNEFQVLFSHYFDKRGSAMRVPSPRRSFR